MASKRRKSRRVADSVDRIRSLPALVLGILLVAAGFGAWFLLSTATVSQALLSKLPRSSEIAGVARLEAFAPATIREIGSGSGIYPHATESLVSLLDGVVPPETFADAFDDEIAFAQDEGHLLAVLEVEDETAFGTLYHALQARLGKAPSASFKSEGGQKVTVAGGRLPRSKRTLYSHREGKTLYLSTDSRLLAEAIPRKRGFEMQEGFETVSNRLPGGADGYVFVTGSATKEYPRLDFSLAGFALRNESDRLAITAANADAPRTAVSLGSAEGSLLPPVSAATLSVSGRGVSEFLQLLEEQRGETDLPKVLRLQNGIASLDQRLGIDLESDYLAAADGAFVYARYADGDRRNWMGLLEFEGAEIARTKVESLESLLRAKLRIPVRREVIRELPDGTRSREIESQKNEPLEIETVTVEGKPAKRTKLPSLGGLVWQVRGQHLVIGNSEESLARMVRTIRTPAPAKVNGQLGLRLDLRKAAAVLGKEDSLFDWILTVRPEGGRFSLDKATGELTGGMTFGER